MGDLPYQDDYGEVAASWVHAPQQMQVSGCEGWTCSTCTYFNSVSSYLACEICGETRPALNSTDACNNDGDNNHSGITAIEDDDYLRRVQEREAEVEREHQALVNARLGEIIEMQHKLLADHQPPRSIELRDPDAELEQARMLEMEREQARLERERELARLEREREQARMERERERARLEKERERLKLEEEMIKEREASLELQRRELEELKQSITNSQLRSSAIDSFPGEKHLERQQRLAMPKSRPGATAVPGPGAIAVSHSPSSMLDRKYEKLEQERQQLEQRQREQASQSQEQRQREQGSSLTRPGATSVVGPGSASQAYTAERKFERLEQERQQLLRQPGALAIPGTGPGASNDVYAPEKKFERLEQERQELLRQQQEIMRQQQQDLVHPRTSGRASNQSGVEIFPPPQEKISSVSSSLSLEQQQSQVQMLLQAQRMSAGMQSQYSIHEPSRASSTRVAPPTPIRGIPRPPIAPNTQQAVGSSGGTSNASPQIGSSDKVSEPMPVASTLAPRQRPQIVATSRLLPPQMPTPSRRPNPLRVSQATVSSHQSSGEQGPPLIPSPESVMPSHHRKGRKGGLGGLLKRPSLLSRATSAPTENEYQSAARSAEFDLPKSPTAPKDSNECMGQHAVRSSMAGLPIADFDQLMDDPSPVWGKSTKKR